MAKKIITCFMLLCCMLCGCSGGNPPEHPAASESPVPEAADGEGMYTKSVEVGEREQPKVDEFEIPVFAGQNELNTLTGKTVAGYQMWFNTGPSASGWVHWSKGDVPKPGYITFEHWPDIREYSSDALKLTAFPDLGNSDKAYLFSSKRQDVVDLHFSWLSEYGIDGLAIQRFYTETVPSRTPIPNHLDFVKNAAEQWGKLFYVMYDMSASGKYGDAAIERIKKDWAYSVEEKGIVSSPSYAYADGKPVVCLWGLSGTDKERYPSAQVALTLVEWFKERGYYVIGGLPDNKWASVKDDYAKVYQTLDMVSPWTVGRYRSDNIKSWWSERFRVELAYCEQYGIDYQPVIFPGFAWSNWNGGAVNDFPRLAGKFMWEQATLLKERGMQNVYIAMFDEYDEGTAIMKTAEDSSMIPQGEQYFYTLASDGTWLSSDFYLRLAGEISKLFKDEREAQKNVPVEHSLGPVYWRNSFEKRVQMNTKTKVESLFNIDVCVNNPSFLISGNVGSCVCEIVESDDAYTGDYVFDFRGESGIDDKSKQSRLCYQIAPTQIKAPQNLQLSYQIKAVNELGRFVYIDLLFSDGIYLSDSKGFFEAVGNAIGNNWTEIIYELDQSLVGKTIAAVAVCYHNTAAGEYHALIDDIVIQVK